MSLVHMLLQFCAIYRYSYYLKLKLLQIYYRSFVLLHCSLGVVEVAPQARPKATTHDRVWLRCCCTPDCISFPLTVHCLSYDFGVPPTPPHGSYDCQQFSDAVLSELNHPLIINRASCSLLRQVHASVFFRRVF